ncbi:MAG: hypothetical protein ACQESR_24910 [Planctomycetota bacterium]
MESCPTQAVLPLVGLAADKVVPDRYTYRRDWIMLREEQLPGLFAHRGCTSHSNRERSLRRR